MTTTSITTVFEGASPDALVCGTFIRPVPDGSWVIVMLGGGDREPMPENRIFLFRSHDRGTTWSSPEPVDLGAKAADPNRALLADWRIAMLIRGDGTGRLQYAESSDGGITWPEASTPTDIPNP